MYVTHGARGWYTVSLWKALPVVIGNNDYRNHNEQLSTRWDFGLAEFGFYFSQSKSRMEMDTIKKHYFTIGL